LELKEHNLTLGLGWDVSKKTSVDLDASVLIFDHKFALVDTVSFSHLSGLGGAVRHKGDNTSGVNQT